ncbi:hypothetical protein [Flavobacterium hydrophilum]|uniref:Uncharacterized protein n=1 Tax=Flavobacterium hydrophilum TaxID=2211445 RepID=A0A2V4CL34_9FLAO|nr:hypothetical protein [Flavobacterium hydrophilum]PXY46474.1 hypothetical protein DMB68_04685 [Flavobacterium hydrophilum]
MGLSSTISESFKKHTYSIITAIIIALLTFGYLYYILPNNERKEDAKNIAILKGIEEQLKTYIDDQVNYISENKMDSLKLSRFKGSPTVYIDTIIINKNKFKQLEDGTIRLSRYINLSVSSKNLKNTLTQKDINISDSINIDLTRFLTKINSITYFSSFYICPIENGSCQSHKSFISKNVTLADQDSLIKYSRKNGPFGFKESVKRYYADQIKIPRTSYSIYLAAGIDNSAFQTSIRQIDTDLLIFSLLLIVVLILGINFIKPIVSSYTERLSQTDLVGVAFSIGVLIAVFVAFGILSYWNIAVKSRSTNDLEKLAKNIDSSFSRQIMAYQSWTTNPMMKEEWNSSNNKFFGISLKKISGTTSGNEKSGIKKRSPLLKKNTVKTDKKSDVISFKESSKLFNYLDSYFRMDTKGLITTDLSTTVPDIRRKYADRMYFQILKQKNLNNQKIDKLLTAVFSRENNKYQWIYAEKNPKLKDKGITKGIAFRQYFSEELTLPPGTGYMLIDRKGEVLMQNDPEKNLYQNLLNGSKKNLELISLLSGIDKKSFEMEYQGTLYQVYAKKLSIKVDSPIYILGIRDLSHLNRLSMFTFSNGFLISLFYGFFILVITYFYSAYFYAGRLSLFSNHHFYHLFPDNTRAYQYKKLLLINSAAIALAIIMSLISSPSIAFVFCILVGVNLVLINLITLNIRTSNPGKDLFTLLLLSFVFGTCFPLILFSYCNLYFAIIALFVTHTSIINYYRGWREREKKDLNTFKDLNEGVKRKAYTRFLTARLLYHFAVFPFVLISAFYVNEMNDFARYFCSSDQVKVQNKESEKNIINAYSCNCTVESKQPLLLANCKDDIIQRANLRFLDRPAMFEIKNFTFNSLNNKYYLNSTAIVKSGNLYDFIFIVSSLFITLIFLTALIYYLLNFYSNRFFFYDLMQAAYEKYYPCKKEPLANDHIFIPMVNYNDIKKLIEKSDNQLTTPINQKNNITVNEVFDKDNGNEISPALRMDFILNYNNEKFAETYNKVWDSLPKDDETRNVLFDFAQDHFVNYKNKNILMNLMEKGIIDSHQLTGRLKVMSLSFRIFILSKSKNDEKFIQDFKDESKNGTFSKLKIPIFIVAISALILLMYLNKDSYDRVAVMGGSIVSVIALINKFLEANKSL